MSDGFFNVYEDDFRAGSYAALEFPGTYYLAFRDLPGICGVPPAPGTRALDFGCGAGRSTRFLRDLGFAASGVDISAAMLERARERDPAGDYRQVAPDGVAGLALGSFDLVLSAFTFDNVPERARKLSILRSLREVLRPDGRFVNLVSSPEIYWHEWASFSTRDYPENRHARCGDEVRIVMLDVADRRPVVDVLWTEEDYRALYAAAGFRVLAVHRPLGRADEPYDWVSETQVAPWTIYEIGRADACSSSSSRRLRHSPPP